MELTAPQARENFSRWLFMATLIILAALMIGMG